jgi:hypothetical protein
MTFPFSFANAGLHGGGAPADAGTRLVLWYGQSLSIGTTPAGTYANVVSSETPKNITGAVVGGGKVTITSAAHGFSNGDPVFIKGMGGMTQPNYASFYVADVTTDTFTLKFMDGTVDPGTGYGTYTSGGTVARALVSGTHRMLSGGIRPHMNDRVQASVNVDSSLYVPTQAASLKYLFEEGHHSLEALGEIGAYGMGLQLTNPSVFFSLGRGAMDAQNLSRKDLSPGQMHFGNCLTAGKRAFDFLKAANEIVSPQFTVVYHQGEGDGSASVSKATWKSLVQGIRDDLLAGYRHVYQETPTMHFLMYQLSQKSLGGDTYIEIAQAASELVDSGNGITVVGPMYWLDFANDGYYDPHLTPESYRIWGEYMGYINQKLLDGETWQPCRITNAVRSGTTITLTVYVPEGALTVDTTRIGAVTNRGFVYSGATITAVNITDDGSTDNTATIEITLNTAAGGTLDYAMDNGVTGYNGRLYGPRGNIRGTSTFVANYGSTACHPWLLRYRGTIA